MAVRERWRTRHVNWSPEKLIVTCGEWNGLPVIPWGRADRDLVATRRQLRAAGLRPGGADPVAALRFEHARIPGRRVEHAPLYLIEQAKPKRTATPAQRAAIDKALTARRTCQECGAEQDRCVSTTSRMCVPCEDRTDFWVKRAAEHGWTWDVPTADGPNTGRIADCAREPDEPDRRPHRPLEEIRAAVNECAAAVGPGYTETDLDRWGVSPAEHARLIDDDLRAAAEYATASGQPGPAEAQQPDARTTVEHGPAPEEPAVLRVDEAATAVSEAEHAVHQLHHQRAEQQRETERAREVQRASWRGTGAVEPDHNVALERIGGDAA